MAGRGHDRDSVETITASHELDKSGREPAGVPCVTVVDSPDASARGRRFAVGAGLVIGRTASEGASLVLRDRALSRRHVAITAGAAFVIEDLGSRNGTFVDGARVTRAEAPPRSLVRAGDTVLEVGFDDPAGDDDEGELVGSSAPMRRLRAEIREVAPSRLPILLLGETGTGKELAARRLHEESGRRGPFVAQNVAAIPATLFESALFGHEKGAFTGATQRAIGCFAAAEGGTLFLDEIAELPLDLQPKLLRVLETLEYTPVGGAAPVRADVRVIAATNADLPSEVRAGSFRADLYARIAGATVRLPPLRERRTDIARLARSFFAALDPPREPRWTPSFVEALVSYEWPLNVRELRSAVERLALVRADVLERGHLERIVGHEIGPARRDRGVPERAELERVLRLHGGNVTRAAKHFGKHAKQLYRWLAHHGIQPDAFRGP